MLVACPTCSGAGAMSKQREKSFSLLSVCQGSDLSQPTHTHTTFVGGNRTGRVES